MKNMLRDSFILCLSLASLQPAQVMAKSLSDISDLKAFTRADAVDSLPYFNYSASFPPSMQGIWWMADTPSTFELLTVATCEWDQEKRAITIDMTAQDTYAYIDSEKSKASLAPLLASNAVYVVEFNETFDFATIRLEFGSILPITVPDWLLSFTMTLQEDGNWLRKSRVLAWELQDYVLTKIVDDNGIDTRFFDKYVKSKKSDSLLIFKYQSEIPKVSKFIAYQ
jgi:hypothetical protein